MRDLTTTQEQVYSGSNVQRQLLIEVELDQMYYFSTRADQFSYDGNLYLAGFVRRPLGIVSSELAEFAIWNTNFEHTKNAKNGAYRQGYVRVMDGRGSKHTIPYVELGYHEEGYIEGSTPNDVPEPITLHEGIIYSTTPTIEGWLEIVSKPDPFNYYPSAKLRPPFANHLPMDGDTFEFDGAIMTIEDDQ